MHCAWLPLLKHFTNDIRVPERSAPRLCQPSVVGGTWRRKSLEGKLSGLLEHKQMALVLLSALAIWGLLKLMTSPPVPAHQPTVAQDTTCACTSDAVALFFILLRPVSFLALRVHKCV